MSQFLIQQVPKNSIEFSYFEGKYIPSGISGGAPDAPLPFSFRLFPILVDWNFNTKYPSPFADTLKNFHRNILVEFAIYQAFYALYDIGPFNHDRKNPESIERDIFGLENAYQAILNALENGSDESIIQQWMKIYLGYSSAIHNYDPSLLIVPFQKKPIDTHAMGRATHYLMDAKQAGHILVDITDPLTVFADSGDVNGILKKSNTDILLLASFMTQITKVIQHMDKDCKKLLLNLKYPSTSYLSFIKKVLQLDDGANLTLGFAHELILDLKEKAKTQKIDDLTQLAMRSVQSRTEFGRK